MAPHSLHLFKFQGQERRRVGVVPRAQARPVVRDAPDDVAGRRLSARRRARGSGDAEGRDRLHLQHVGWVKIPDFWRSRSIRSVPILLKVTFIETYFRHIHRNYV